MSRFLSTKTLVLGGFISYSLYMTHLVWYGLWRAGMKAAHISGGVLYALGFVALVAIAVGAGIAIAGRGGDDGRCPVGASPVSSSASAPHHAADRHEPMKSGASTRVTVASSFTST